ncbi:MAG: hypothetical protein ACOYL1_06060 [Chlamydiia bacterium]
MSSIKVQPHIPQPIVIFEEDTPRINLSTSEDVRREMARVYRDSRANKISPQEGTRLVYMLSQILKAHEIYILERKLSELESLAPGGMR